MCSRYSLSTPAETLAEHFRLERIPPLTPRHNIAPSQQVPIVRLPLTESRPQMSGREMTLVRWGLIPAWAKDPAIGNRMINARAETVAEKPAFREAFARRRCLVPADGYYEWQRVGRGKQPCCIRMRDGRPFAFAGLWEQWTRPDGKVVETCAILTTEPNETLRPIHDRMPVILDPDNYDLWLDPGVRSEEKLRPLLGPYPGEEMTICKVPNLNDLYTSWPSAARYP